MINTDFIRKGYLFLSFLVDFLEKYNRIDEALIVFDKCIRLNPNDIWIFYKKGYLFLSFLVDFLEKYNRIDEALVVIDEVVKLNPK